MLLSSLLVIASAALHAGWNALLRHRGEARANTVAVSGALTLVSTVVMLATPQPWFPDSAGFWWSVAAGVLEAGYFVTLGLALEHAPVGIAYPISRGGALIVVWPISLLWLDEAIGWGSAIGAVTVFVGLLATGFQRPHAGERLGVRWAAASAAFIGVYNLFYKQALNAHAEPMALFAVSMLVAFPLTLLWMRGRARRVFEITRELPWRMLGAGLLSTGSFWLYLYALRSGGTGEILTLRNTSVVFAQLFAAWTGEKLGRRQLIGAGVIVAGALVLGFARG